MTEQAEITKKPRPGHYAKEVLELVAREILPEVMAWLQRNGAEDPCEKETLDDLVRAIRGNHDAYDIARELERAHWSPDFALCEILDNFSTYSAHSELVKQWVAENGVELPLSVGQEVETRQGRGRITELRPETAEYIVTPPDDDRFMLGGGWVIAAEDATPVAA